jgi:hypothetical protein
MSNLASRKSFATFVNELERKPVLGEGKQRSSHVQKLHRKLTAQEGTPDDDPSAERGPNHLSSLAHSIRLEFAALYLDLDSKLAELERSPVHNESRRQDGDVAKSIQKDTAMNGLVKAPIRLPALAEGNQVPSQAKSLVLATIGHIQQLHRQMLADHSATTVNRNLSAEITYLSALIGTLFGVILNDGSVVARANTFRA